MVTQTPKTLFVTGTDTDVGKTYVASLLVRALVEQGQRVGVYKPVASGCIPAIVTVIDGRPELTPPSGNDLSDRVATDALELWAAAGMPGALEEVCPQRFELPVAPPAAAAAENREVDVSLLVAGVEPWHSGFDWLIIEGAGGFFSPLAEGVLNIDLYRQLGSPPLMLVTANRLGTIHQTIATCLAAEHAGFRFAGVLLNAVESTADPSVKSNEEQLRKYCDADIIASMEFGQKEFPAEALESIQCWHD